MKLQRTGRGEQPQRFQILRLIVHDFLRNRFGVARLALAQQIDRFHDRRAQLYDGNTRLPQDLASLLSASEVFGKPAGARSEPTTSESSTPCSPRPPG